MIFQAHQVSPALAPFVESIFFFENFQPDHSIERVVPTGHLFLLFELDDLPRYVYDNQSLEAKATYQKVWISGMHRHYISISAPQNSSMFVIQFKAHGAYPFLHLPIQRLNEQVLPAVDILGASILELRTAILQKKGAAAMFQLAENWLTQRFDPKKVPSPVFLNLLEQLQKESANQYPQIVKRYPHSTKHLIDQCKTYIGLTPKYYQRILRFNEILHNIQQKQNISWSQISYQAGYADQSHFIKEFKHFSGFNPQEFILEEHHRDATNFFPLDRDKDQLG